MGIIRPAIGHIYAGSRSEDLGLSDRRHTLAGVGREGSEQAAPIPDRLRLRFRRLDERKSYADSVLARISCQRLGRFLASRTFFRRRMDFGVTSTNSSSAMNSIAFSKVMSRGGISRMASSAEEERMLVCFFSLVKFTFMSSSRAFSPRIIPSYTSIAGPTNISPRS